MLTKTRFRPRSTCWLGSRSNEEGFVFLVRSNWFEKEMSILFFFLLLVNGMVLLWDGKVGNETWCLGIFLLSLLLC